MLIGEATAESFQAQLFRNGNYLTLSEIFVAAEGL